MKRLRTELREFRDGIQLLRSRAFWRAFRDYWSGQAIAARLDDFAARLRDLSGKR